MTKEQALEALKLLSALESWAFSTKTSLPNYLLEKLYQSMQVLESIILEEENLYDLAKQADNGEQP